MSAAATGLPVKPMPGTSRRRFLMMGIGGLLLPTTSLVTACGGGSSSVAATPKLASIDNFRDLAGADDASVYINQSGRKLRRGVFYRSNALTATDADLAVLGALGISTVYDLRTPAEIAKTPDRTLSGVKNVNVNVMGTTAVDTPNFTSAAQATAFMEETERSFVTDAGIRTRIGALLSSMADTSDAQLFHCSAGKDRTGWVAALLQTIAGLSMAAIEQDYLLSNHYSQASIAASYEALVKAKGKEYADSYYPVLGVQRSYLMAGVEQAVGVFGSMDAYISNGLGVDDRVRELLRQKLLA